MTAHNGTKRFPSIKKINTKILASIVESDGRTDIGSDYGPLLEEIKAELHRRQKAQALREQRTFEREMLQMDASKGKTCPKCCKTYPLDQVDANFYKVANAPHRYRPRCKTCHVEAARINRTQAPF